MHYFFLIFCCFLLSSIYIPKQDENLPLLFCRFGEFSPLFLYIMRKIRSHTALLFCSVSQDSSRHPAHFAAFHPIQLQKIFYCCYIFIFQSLHHWLNCILQVAHIAGHRIFHEQFLAAEFIPTMLLLYITPQYLRSYSANNCISSFLSLICSKLTSLPDSR